MANAHNLARNVNERSTNNTLLLALQRMETAKFIFQTPDEACALSALLANVFPAPQQAEEGLQELTLNAVEHGNLEIGFKEKSRLLDAGAYHAEIERRLANESYCSRLAEIVIAQKKDGVYCVIKDQGGGFDWREFTKFSPARASHKNGRGVQIARLTAFDRLAYNEAGNQVSVFTALPEKKDAAQSGGENRTAA